MHRSHAQSRGFETHKTKAIESSIAIVHQGVAIDNSNVFRCRLYCLFGDGVCDAFDTEADEVLEIADI